MHPVIFVAIGFLGGMVVKTFINEKQKSNSKIQKRIPSLSDLVTESDKALIRYDNTISKILYSDKIETNDTTIEVTRENNIIQ